MIIHPPKETGLEIAKILLETKAVLIAKDEPFTLTSGRKSPVYIDGKRLISFPKHRATIINAMASLLQERKKEYDVVAGIESGSIAYAAFIAERLDAPLIYLRKKPKGFGKQAQVEGIFNQNDSTLIIEDVTSDGGSKVTFSKVMRDAGGKVEDIFTIFFYNSFDYSEKILNEANVNLHYLSSWEFILEALKTDQSFDTKTVENIAFFLESPDEWAEKVA
jgi:orotate phosphoribosyltransferase